MCKLLIKVLNYPGILHRIKYTIVPGLIKGLHKKRSKASGKVFVV